MNVEFMSITLSNFRSFTAPQTLTFAQTGGGVMFMRGRNEVEPKLGANATGKTSTWQALCWCIYGKTPDGLRSPDVKPWSGDGSPTVSLVLNVDGKPHTMTRSTSAKGVLINGRDVGNEEAVKLIGLSFEVFKQTVILAQSQPLFFDLSSKDKMQLFSEVLQLDRWEERSAAASAKADELYRLESELMQELVGAVSQLEQANALLALTKKQSDAWEADRGTRVQQLEQTLEQHSALLIKQQNALDDADLAQERISLDLTMERALAAGSTAEHHRTLEEVKSAEALQTFDAKTLAHIEYELAGLGEKGTCPVCHQSITGTGLESHKKELSDKAGNLQKALSSRASVILSIKDKLKMIDTARRDTTTTVSTLERALQQVQTKVNFFQLQIAELKAVILGLKDGRRERTDQTNPHRTTLQDLKTRLRGLETEGKGIEETLIKLQRQIERTKFWVKGFKELRLYAIDEVLQELEITTNLLLPEVGLQDWRVTYSVERETKSGTVQRGVDTVVVSPHNKQSVKQGSWSGGESQRLRIVSALALSQVLLNFAGVEVNLEVLDEPTKHLSAEGVQELCEFLSTRAQQLGRQCWLVDHTARESSNFAGVVTVVKTQEGSYFEGVL